MFQGADCLAPDARHCLVILSLSGEDASFYREFDTVDKKFIPGGFELPHSKQRAAWLDRDTLLVSRDWGPDTMTRSGYPFSVRVVKRGEPLAAAKEIYRGTPDDMIVERKCCMTVRADRLRSSSVILIFFAVSIVSMTLSHKTCIF